MPSPTDRPNYPLALRQSDQLHADFAGIESDLKFVMDQLARLPTRAYFCRTLLISTASAWALIVAVALLWQ
jgi:hypothetical protein